MRSRMSPTGHVLPSVLPDRQSLLGSSRGSYNKNILYTTTYSHHYIRLYIFIYIHIKPYTQVCTSFIPMSIIIYPGTYALMYSCTDVLLYSCTHIVNVYDTATVWRLYLRNNTSVYILYISGPANNLKISNTPTECPHPHLGIV